jgi:hypothetical protein
MWSVLKPSDIGAAQQQLASRRDELLRRQAEERTRLDTDAADLEALDRLARAFAVRFKKTAPAAPEIAVTAAAPAADKADPPASQHQYSGGRPHPRAAQSDRRGVAGTNFEVFSRAISKSAF